MTTKQKLLVLLLFVVVILYIASGYIERPDVFITSYSVSEDGSEMTVTAGVATSAGYIRAVSTEKEGEILKLSFYKTFGGANSSYGSQNEFTFELPADVTEIKLFRGDGEYKTVLTKSSDGEWILK